MQTVIIDEEFKDLLPALDKNIYASLEENLISQGCRDSLIVWKDILIDGYNRYEICTKHNIPYNTVSKDFSNREEALIWIISNQVSRRNLTPVQLSLYRGLHYKADKKIQGTNNQYSQNNEKSQNETFQKSTATRLASQYNVSRNTILRDSKLADSIAAIGEASPEAKRKILSGELKMDKKVLEGISLRPKEEIEAVVAEIVDGTYEKKPSATPAMDELEGYCNTGSEFDSGSTKTQRLENIVAMITNGYDSFLQKTGKKYGVGKLKTALRAYIDSLEVLYRNI